MRFSSRTLRLTQAILLAQGRDLSQIRQENLDLKEEIDSLRRSKNQKEQFDEEEDQLPYVPWWQQDIM
eukprot:SAG31_NODE_8848_length_1376_cov_1.368833_2_plen_68_part_00